MLSKSINSIYTTFLINAKSIKISFMNYFMMVIVYPVSYLVISVLSGNGEYDLYYITGIFTSIYISLFINMEAVMIANKNNITISEMYAVYNVRKVYVFWGESFFHLFLLLPFLLLEIGVLHGLGVEVYFYRLIIYLLVSFIFMSVTAMSIGSILKNPQIASAVINMIYMIIIMTTPIYNNVSEMSELLKRIYSINPFSSICSLWYWTLGMETIINPNMSILFCAGVSLVLYIYVNRSWNNRGAVEKLNIW